MVKNLPTVQETPVPSLGSKMPWRRAGQPTPVFLLRESPRTEAEPARLRSMWSLRVGHDRATQHSTVIIKGLDQRSAAMCEFSHSLIALFDYY